MVKALQKEITLSLDFNSNRNEMIDTIYFGGGTPSLLDKRDIEDLLFAIKNSFTISPTAEVTLEANPDDISIEKLDCWKDAGINRLSIGIQSFKEKDLQWMNRAHNNLQALECILLTKRAGFNNFSTDLIYGTPGLTDEEWKQNVQQLIQLNVPHIAGYALTVEPNTALKKMIILKKKEDINTRQQANQFLLLMKWMKEEGYEHYEISNFAKPGFRSRHNSSYWQGKNYIGIGPSAHSYNGAVRRWNVANNAFYINSVKNNLIPFEEEILTENQKLNEYIMTSLRTIEGLNLKFVEENFSANERNRIEATSKKYILNEKIFFIDEKLVLSDKGKLFADGIASDLFTNI